MKLDGPRSDLILFSSQHLFQETAGGLLYGLNWVFLQETQYVKGHRPTRYPHRMKNQIFQNHQKYFCKCLEFIFNNINCGEHLGFHVLKDILSCKTREQSNGQAYDALRYSKCITCISDASMQLFCATFCNLFLTEEEIVTFCRVTNCCEADTKKRKQISFDWCVAFLFYFILVISVPIICYC